VTIVERSRVTTRSSMSRVNLIAEVEKCDVVCANCRVMRTDRRDAASKKRVAWCDIVCTSRHRDRTYKRRIVA
jgi:hypothetical protein